MTVGLTYPHIDKPPGEATRLKSHPRVRVAQLVMDYLAHGWSAEEMCRQHTYLSPAEAHAALAYYYDHRDEIDREIQTEAEKVEHDRTRASRSPFFLRTIRHRDP
jgi:hypothetical protein